MKPSISRDRPRPLLILGRVPNASDLALRRILHAKEPGQALVIVDYQGSVTSMLRFGAAMLAGPFSLHALQSKGFPASVTTV